MPKKLAILVLLSASFCMAQTVFNCSSGFASSGTCGVVFNGTNQTFLLQGAGNGTWAPTLVGTAVQMAPVGGGHTAVSMNYKPSVVNVQAFQSSFNFLPNGWNISLILQNNTSTQGGDYGLGPQFSSGAGCEGSIIQNFPNGGLTWDPPNNIFALMIDQNSPLTDADAPWNGGGPYPGTYTYSSTQIYQQVQEPCNPRDGSEPYFYQTNRQSTYPVPLNSPATAQNVPTGDNYTATITYTGSNVTLQLYDTTAGNSCPGANCFTYTWNNVYIPSMVNGTTAWVGLGESTNATTTYPLNVNTFSYTVLQPASAPTFSVASGTYGSTQSVTLSSSSSGSIICYNTTGSPTTNGVGSCASGTLYTGAISVAKGQTIYAVAGSGTTSYGDSTVASAAYNITGSAASPSFSVSTGAYQGNQTLILTTPHGGVICYNTTGSPATNGSTGCTTGTLYTAPIVVSSNETVYAVAGGTGFTDSPIGSAAYIISQFWGSYPDSPLPPASPTFSPLPGSYSGPQTVTLASTTAGTNICYTVASSLPAMPPYPDSAGGCTVGTMYTGPITVSSSQTIYATAGTSLTTYQYLSGCATCQGSSTPSTLSSARYAIASVTTPEITTGIKASGVKIQ